MEDLDVKVGETVAQIVGQCEGQRPVPRPQLLPTRISFNRLPQGLGGEQHAIGVRGRDLQPLVIDFAVDPLLAVYGDDHQGKSTFIRNTVASIVAGRRSPEDAIVILFDPKRRLGDLTRLLVEKDPASDDPADFYATDFATMANYVRGIGQILDRRQPPADLGWEQRTTWSFVGPKIFLVVDDLDVIPVQVEVDTATRVPVAAGVGVQEPQFQIVNKMVTIQMWDPLLRHFANAIDRGLRVVVTHRAAEVTTAEIDRRLVPHHIASQPSTRILLGSRQHNEKVAGVKFEAGLVPGRGNALASNDDNAGYVQLAALPDAK
jgi:hypothetical protein